MQAILYFPCEGGNSKAYYQGVGSECWVLVWIPALPSTYSWGNLEQGTCVIHALVSSFVDWGNKSSFHIELFKELNDIMYLKHIEKYVAWI